MQQYREIKARHPGTLLFFRMGDFYEMFEDDARLAARELGLTLTARNNGGAADVPLAGVPVKAATEYLRRLIALGHRVAICEQVEDPKLAKGLVRREVIETVTPGTVLAEEWLERKRNNFLVAVDPRGGAAGLAALDLTTGELVLETVAPEDLPTALARYEAPEVVLPAGAPITAGGGAARSERELWEFDPELAREDLTRTFRLASLDGAGIDSGGRSATPRRSTPGSTRWTCWWRMGAGGTVCGKHSTACAISSAWRAAPRWGARHHASSARCATRSIASPTCAPRSTASRRGAGRRCSRRRPIASTCSRTWAASWRARS